MHSCPTIIFIRSEWTCTYVDSIIDSSYNTGFTPELSFYSGYWIHLHNTSHLRFLYLFCIFHYSRGGHCMYNYSLLMYFPILGAELITASCKHDLIVKLTSSSQIFDPGRLINSVDFLFLPKISLAIFLSLSQNLCIGS